MKLGYDPSEVDYRALTRAAFYTPMGRHSVYRHQIDWGARILMRGDPGTNKTSGARALAHSIRDCGWFAFDSTVGEAGCGLIPAVDLEAKMIRHYVADFIAENFVEGKPGLMLVDDILDFPQSLRPYLLGLILDKRLGSTWFDPQWRVFGALNEADDTAVGIDLATNAANRPCHIVWLGAPMPQWKSYILGLADEFEAVAVAEDPETLEDAGAIQDRIAANWQAQFRSSLRIVTGFVGGKGMKMLHNKPGCDDPQASHAWPSRRTWEFAARAHASGKLHGLTGNTAAAFIAGYVGGSAYLELAEYEEKMDLPDPAHFLDGQDDKGNAVSFTHQQYRIDRTAALMDACLPHLIPKDAPNRRARAERYFAFMLEVGTEALDSVAEVLVGTILKKSPELLGSTVAQKALAKCNPMLKSIDKAKQDSRR